MLFTAKGVYKIKSLHTPIAKNIDNEYIKKLLYRSDLATGKIKRCIRRAPVNVQTRPDLAARQCAGRDMYRKASLTRKNRIFFAVFGNVPVPVPINRHEVKKI